MAAWSKFEQSIVLPWVMMVPGPVPTRLSRMMGGVVGGSDVKAVDPVTADAMVRAWPGVWRRRDPLVPARSRLLSHDLDAPVRRVTGLDAPLPPSRPLESRALSAPGAIAAALRAAVE